MSANSNWSAAWKMRHWSLVETGMDDWLTSASSASSASECNTANSSTNSDFNVVLVWSDRSWTAVKSLSIKFVQFNRFRLNEWHSYCFSQAKAMHRIASNCPGVAIADDKKNNTCIRYIHIGQRPHTNHGSTPHMVFDSCQMSIGGNAKFFFFSFFFSLFAGRYLRRMKDKKPHHVCA